MLQPSISLEDKYALDTTRAYMTGIEALVRLPILQHQRDQQAGLNTAGFVSGYRGSPLGALDKTLWKAEPYLSKHNIKFQPGLNEDLAATSVWGTQQVNLFPGARFDGVFSMWYGKGPGVDRSMDVIRHANAFGTSKHGGVLVIAGDDHACKSSSLPHQTDHMFIGVSMPVLAPANVQEVLDLGVYGWELSRYSGCWVALKAIAENMDSALSTAIDPRRVKIIIPEDFEMPEEGVHGHWPFTPLEQERVLNKYRIYAARHFAKVNQLNKIMVDSPNARLGIITAGKSYLDVMQALEDLGIDAQHAADIGLRIYKLGMTWPLEPVTTHQFAKGLEEILVVEEKRSIIEDQLTGQLYNWPVAERPRVVGEYDEYGNDLLTNLGELTPAMIARAIAARIGRFYDSQMIHERLEFLANKEIRLAQPRQKLDRVSHYCSGCPHNTSTRVPEGSRAMGGIGCHYMVTWMDRNTDTFTQMGGEGATWIGQSPFTDTKHVFQNLGDGTYFHSGLLAIRASIAAGVNITYKILYNDAVAMTGGQHLDGTLTVPMLIQQLRGEGVERIAVVSDEPDKYYPPLPQLDGLSLDHRRELERIQCELREIQGTTVIIYDQTCAAEKRRRRKQGTLVDPARFAMINEAVCEGCGDCSKASNCLSVIPLETELGRKRQIDQSACNKDFSCLDGFCPSFITIEGGKRKKKKAAANTTLFPVLPEPQQPNLDTPWNIVVTGIGGTGVLTISAIVAMAAHIEGKGCSTLNQTGLAQKFGSVVSHVRVSRKQSDIYAVRIAAGDADLMLGCDLVVSDSDDALAKLHFDRSHVVMNSFESATASFIKEPDIEFPSDAMKQTIKEEVGENKAHFINATQLATELMGDALAANLFLLGYAYQKGLVPVSAEAIDKAIVLNAVAVEFNQQAFVWGRRAAYDLQAVIRLIPKHQSSFKPLEGLEDIVAYRSRYLEDYQDKGYANQYLDFIEKVKSAEKGLSYKDAELPLTQAVAKTLFKLMAYKDEYEVARLYSDTDFIEGLQEQFEGDFKINFHLAAPLLSKRDSVSGHLLKRSYPQWTLKLMRVLARMKGLRGSRWDFFGYSSERKAERAIIQHYRELIDQLLKDINENNYAAAQEVAELAQKVRGFGHIKAENMKRYYEQLPVVMDKFYGREKQVVRIQAREVG